MDAFSPLFCLGGREVGGEAPVLVIAEAGVFHFGDAGKADALVDLAGGGGVNNLKTQAFVMDKPFHRAILPLAALLRGGQ